MKKNIPFPFRYPAVALTSINGNCKIVTSKCSCEQQNGGRCSHVACLLYLVQVVSHGSTPEMSIPTTSTTQYWGKGSKTKRDPKPVQFADYGKKRKNDQYIKLDPRPAHLQKTSDQEIFDFVKANQSSASKLGHDSGWVSVFKITYDDFDISLKRKYELFILRRMFLQNLESDLAKYSCDELSTAYGVHVTDTIEQSDNSNWFSARKYRITASVFLEFSRNPKTFMKMFWGLSQIPETAPLKYGKDNELNAIVALQEKLGCEVNRCGLFISRR